MEAKSQPIPPIVSGDLFSPEALARLMDKHGHRPAAELGSLQKLTDTQYIAEKFLSHDTADVVNELPIDECEIVTGFGPTNAPTGGTLSVIFKAMSLMRETGIPATIVISNIGAYCSRKTPSHQLRDNTDHFISFLTALGVEKNGARIRTHEDLDVLTISGLLTRVLSSEQLEANKEATSDLYGSLGLLGNRLGVYFDTLLTVADILEPMMCRGKRRVLVLSGIEEHYFADLARMAVVNFDSDFPGQFIPSGCKIGGLYARLLRGLDPYPKMSKSIPESAINISDSKQVLTSKIMCPSPQNEECVLQMMTLVSDWSAEKLAAARVSFEQRGVDQGQWMDCKKEYLAYFQDLQRCWIDSAASESTTAKSLLPRK